MNLHPRLVSSHHEIHRADILCPPASEIQLYMRHLFRHLRNTLLSHPITSVSMCRTSGEYVLMMEVDQLLRHFRGQRCR